MMCCFFPLHAAWCHAGRAITPVCPELLLTLTTPPPEPARFASVPRMGLHCMLIYPHANCLDDYWSVLPPRFGASHPVNFVHVQVYVSFMRLICVGIGREGTIRHLLSVSPPAIPLLLAVFDAVFPCIAWYSDVHLVDDVTAIAIMALPKCARIFCFCYYVMRECRIPRPRDVACLWCFAIGIYSLLWFFFFFSREWQQRV